MICGYDVKHYFNATCVKTSILTYYKLEQLTKSPDYLLSEVTQSSENRASETTAGLFATAFR